MRRTAGSIIVGVDGSDSAQRALVWAAEQASDENRVLTLLHAVLPFTPVLLDPRGHNPREARDLSLQTRGREVLDAARDEVHRVAPEVTVEDLCVLEDPREALVELSETGSMVVLGSRGRGHMKSLLLGSTAIAVVRHAHCPVVVHRPSSSSPQRHGIAVGADATEDSAPVLEFAYRQASIRNLPLTVVHSFWYFNQPPTAAESLLGDTSPSVARQSRALAETLAGFAEKYPDVSVRIEIDQGMPERYLLRLADSMNMLVVGVHHGTRAEQFMFGSVSVWLVEHATCQVAVIPLSAD